MPTPSSRWLVTLIPVTASMAVSIVLAVATNNPLSLVVGLMMPVMMLMPAFERWFERRRARKLRHSEIRGERDRHPSPRELLELGHRRVPEWSLPGHNAEQTEKQIRLGIAATGEVVRVDLSGGVNVIGDPEVGESVVRAIVCSIGWSYGLGSDAPPVELDDTGARWIVGVRPDATGFVVDRTGVEADIQSVVLDVMAPSEHELFAEVLNEFHVTNQVHELDWDLFSAGPHALVSGVTGSGKTVLLRQWIAQLVTDPSAPATVGLIDFKGGGGFGDLVTNGLVASMATNLHLDGVELAMDGMRALLMSRAALLAEHSCLSIDELAPDVRPPRAVIIVDEYRALLDEFADAQKLFVDICSRGRALGVHLILATQRFSGVASDALTSNCGIRVALRAGDQTESRQVVGIPDACDPQLQAGEGFVVTPGRAVRRLKLVVDPIPIARDSAATASKLWLEPLVEVPTWRELGGSNSQASLIRLGLVDDHRSLCRRSLEVDANGQALVLVGGDREARHSLLVAIGQQLEGIVLPDDAVAAWDALARVSEPTGLIAHNLDALEAELPLAWREAFVELFMNRARSALAAGHSVAITLASESGIARQVQSLPHHWVVIDGDSPSLNGESFAAVRPVGEGIRSVEAALDVIDELNGTLLISPHAAAWRARAIPGLTVADVEDIVFGRVTRTDFTRVFVDGCSPMDARSMRLSAEHLPPPQAGTVLEVDEFGCYGRVAVAVKAAAIEL